MSSCRAEIGHRSKTAPLMVLILLLASLPARAQTTPPACPSPTVNPTEGIHHTVAHPSPEQLRATANSATQDATILAGQEPANLGIARYHVEEYADCTGNAGCYWADLDAQAHRAELELDHLLAQRKVTTAKQAEAAKLAVVLDIDETSLSSYCEEKREDYGFIPQMFNEWVVSPGASLPIVGMLRLFRHAREAGVAVFFLTGRPHEQTDATARNLRSAGYNDWQGLILRAEQDRNIPTIEYKSAERAKLIARGYILLLNVGDQWSDLLGVPQADRSVKLPNPFYYLP